MPQIMTKRTDSEIQQDVLHELKWDTRVEETDVGVEVDEGVVTLSGTVSSWGKRYAAEEAAHRVWGVLDVANDVAVRTPGAPGRTDTEIAHAVREALEWDVFVPDRQVRSTVSDAVVTLKGDVGTWSEREDAERAVRNLAGVRGVINHLEVKPSRVTPADVKKSLEDALERQAGREAMRITVDVRDTEVTLSGAVHSWAAKQAALGAAKGMPGVRSVRDQLRIEQHD
jgi:osmotically-inducible protein OsmY